ncbi:MAG: NUDIX hydrolase [Clostridia bacterium]|nr:NUDIX hydrolase [Clostridia bacterium]
MRNENFFEKRIVSEQIFEGKVLDVRKDSIILPDGKPAYREYCKHIGAVCVLPLTNDNEVVFVRQYRYAHSRVMLEIPAGKLDSNSEDFIQATLRELREETGISCEKLEFIGDIIPSPAILTEVIHMYLARGLSFGETDFDEDEFIEIVKIPLEKAVDMVMNGEIRDAKTQAAVLKTYFLMSKENKDEA